MIPQIIYIALIFITWGMSMAKHGESEVKTENFWTTLLSTIFTTALLYAGGFFDSLFK